MKRLVFGVLAAGATALLTGGVVAPTAQAEPDLHVMCHRTMDLDGSSFNSSVVAFGCVGGPSFSSGDRGKITLMDHDWLTLDCAWITTRGSLVEAHGCRASNDIW